MSDEKIYDANVKVLNEEYQRVLTNPENIIVSEDLQALLDIPMPSEESSTGIDTMVLSVLDADNLPISIRGEFSCISKSGIEYSIIVVCSRIKKDFLEALDSLTNTPGMLTVQGEYTLEIQDCSLTSWSITQSAGTDFSLSIQFRSENGIF